MKRLLSSFTLLSALCLAAPASAADGTYGPRGYTFTVDVPSGWTAQKLGDGVNMSSADMATSFTHQVKPLDGKKLDSVVAQYKALTEARVTVDRKDDENYVVTVEKDGIPVRVILKDLGARYAQTILRGKDMAALEKILASLGK